MKINNRIIKFDFDNKFNLNKSFLRRFNYKELRNLLNRERIT